MKNELGWTFSEERSKWWAFLETALLKGSHSIRPLLGIDESGFRFVAAFSHADARGFYLYRVMDEVQKAAVALIRWKEVLEGDQGEDPVDEEQKQLDRIILESLVDEQSLWVRKLLEVLINLINFDGTNSDEHYRHYLLYADLERTLSAAADLEEFYGCESRNLREGHSWTVDRIKKLESAGISREDCWYLTDKPLEHMRPGGVFTSIRKRIRLALPRADSTERMAIGLSYESVFSRMSRSLHFSPLPPIEDPSLESLFVNGERIGMLGLLIIQRCHGLLGQTPGGINEQINRVMKDDSDRLDTLSKLTTKRAEVGDIVVAGGDLAAVIAVRESDFGYESYEVEYLDARPIPGIDTDCFVPQEVHLLFKSTAVTDLASQQLAEGRMSQEDFDTLERRSPDEAQQVLRDVAADLWTRGLRDEVLGIRSVKPKEAMAESEKS